MLLVAVLSFNSSDQIGLAKTNLDCKTDSLNLPISVSLTLTHSHKHTQTLRKQQCVESLSSVFFHLLFARVCRLDHTIQMWFGLRYRATETPAQCYRSTDRADRLWVKTEITPEHIYTAQFAFIAKLCALL